MNGAAANSDDELPRLMLYWAMAYTAADVEMVESHIIQGERHIVRQQELIERLGKHGLPTREAEELLKQFHETLEQHWLHRAAMLEAIRLSERAA